LWFEPRRDMQSVERHGTGVPIRLERELEPFSVEVVPDRERVVVVPRGELDMATVDQVAGAIDELVARGFAAIVLDLRATSFLDCSGVHLVLRETARTDARVTLIDGAPEIGRVLDVVGVRHLLRFEPGR
jgi:anti-sigma B factor antagonist